MTADGPPDAKRAAERFWWAYTPVWTAITGVVMVSGLAERWTDAPLLAFGLLVGVPAAVGPVLLRPDRDTPWWRSTAFKLALSVTGLAFGLNYTQTPYFWDVLHMHYGFRATWTIDGNPVFLYLVTVAYFGTYCALCLAAWRWLRARGPVAAAASWVVAPMAMALLETVLNANPFTTRLFCYDDLPLMLTFGTVSYGMAFVLALPMWAAIDERAEARVPWTRVVLMLGAVLYADLLGLDVLRYHVAPRLTVVHTGVRGAGDNATSCLAQPVGR
ncbi:MAG: hypothetical protein H6733_18085 [Alphaproteobacteria bacterium]|nr:hypothetical protein [Alphaproteobacteria bacterium]